MFATWKWSNHVIVNLQVNLGLKHVWLQVHHEAAWAAIYVKKLKKPMCWLLTQKKKTTLLAAKNETAESTTRQTQVLLTAQLPMSTSML